MAVNLSPVGGVAAQFFTNTGAVLTGGKLYTYAAGTTTPQSTYTTSAGNVARTNPIVLDSAGRVPGSGEIWVTVGVSYKFLLKDSNDVLIGTYDNVSSEFNTNASLVTYTPAGTGAVTTTVQAKLRQTVSVQDFGAVGDGTTDDTSAILLAIAAMPANGAGLNFPPGTYLVNSNNLNGLKFNNKSNFVVSGYGATIKVKAGASVVGGYEVMSFFNCSNGAINGLTIDGNRANRTIPGETSAHLLTICTSCSQITVNDVIAINSPADGFLITTFDYTVAATYPTDITLVNCVADNAYRNGLSSIGSLRLTLRGGEYKNTNGTLPKCGIDIEPDAGYTYGNQDTIIDGARLFNNDGYGLALGGPAGLNNRILITNVTGANNDLGFLNIASCDNPTLRDVVAYNHPTATRGIIDVGTLITNPIIDGADFFGITASSANYCIFLHGSITGVPTIHNINVEACTCPILYSDIRSDIDSIYGNNITATDAITLTQAYSSLKNLQLSNCSDRAVYVSGTNVTLDGLHLVNCGQANSRAIQIQAADAIVRNVDILFTGARPTNFIGILFNSGAPKFISNVLAKAASSDFSAANVMTFASSVAGVTLRNVSPSPFSVSQAWDPGNIANGASESVIVSVPNVVFGMVCYASFGISIAGMTLSATVSQASPGQITATLSNNTGGAINLASSTLTVWAEGF